ncbi:MAG: hypothetical protein HYZ26_05720 [Chloroflexi bacterium]|nr:hypothetical protein [Chloroflexota bacterium]
MDYKALQKTLDAIYASDDPEVQKLARAFDALTAAYVERAAAEIELFKALTDEENLLKERLKHGVMINARSMFNDCYRRITGNDAWRMP